MTGSGKRHNCRTNTRQRPWGLSAILSRVLALAGRAAKAQSPWQALQDQHIIDGHALWDQDERLVDHSGFLGTYLPQLAQWHRPSAGQTMTALMESGQVALPPAAAPDQTMTALSRLGVQTLPMTDGQIFRARNVPLGQTGHVTIFSNITEFHADSFRDAFDAAPMMMVLLDSDMGPLAVNRAFRTHLGHDCDHLVQRGWSAIIHPDDTALPWSPGTRRFISANGDEIRAQLRTSPLSEGKGRMLVTLEDLTPRWEAKERMRFQAALLDQIGAAVLAVDGHGRVSYGNSAAQALFHWSEAVLPGTAIERLLGAEIRLALDSAAAGITELACITELECEGTTWGGTRFPAQLAMAPLRDGAGRPHGAALVVTDLTPRRALDLQLMHSARLATLGELAASIAHEFNQCLHVIRLSSEALRMDMGDGVPDPARAVKRADNILSQVDRLTEMVTHMSSISRRDTSGKRPFQPQSALDAARRMMEPLLLSEGITLVRQGQLDQRMVLGHQVRLEQVLLNLLSNGRDSIRERFRRDGNTGGALTVICTAQDGRLRIIMRDDGTGVPEKAGHHIFEPFFTTKDSGRGCGLGLSISRGICAEMSGSLSFRNLDRGAEFTIDLPELMDTATASPAQPPPPATSDSDFHDDDDLGEDRRILLVDDEALSVMMVSEFLERQGYDVDTAYDGVEALEKCHQHIYHAVITDIRMPRMDGHELIARLEDLQPGTPIIVVTGHLKEDNAAQLGANVVAMLSKPFQLQELRDHLHRLDHVAGQPQECGV